MKKKKLLIGIVPFLLAMVFVSCKDSYVQPDFTKVPPIVELPVANLQGNGGGNYMKFTLDKGTAVDNYIIVNYAAPNPNTTDVNVTMAVDAAVLTKYNSVNGTTYTGLTPDTYTLNNNVVIPAGAGKVEYHVKINTASFTPDVYYAIPLKIVSASGVTVSGNFGTLVMLVKIAK